MGYTRWTQDVLERVADSLLTPLVLMVCGGVLVIVSLPILVMACLQQPAVTPLAVLVFLVVFFFGPLYWRDVKETHRLWRKQQDA